MAATRQPRSLQLQHDPDFHRRMYRLQRIAWAAMGLTVLAAALGLFGSGPLSRTTVDLPDGSLSVEHDRFGRVDAPTTLRIRLAAAPGPDGLVLVRLGRDAVDRVRIDRITPEPARSASGRDGLALWFASEGRDGEAVVTVHHAPERPGVLRWRVAAEGRPALRFNQLVYP